MNEYRPQRYNRIFRLPTFSEKFFIIGNKQLIDYVTCKFYNNLLILISLFAKKTHKYITMQLLSFFQ